MKKILMILPIATVLGLLLFNPLTTDKKANLEANNVTYMVDPGTGW